MNERDSKTQNPLTAALQIREQLASEKRKLAFFFGAGSSMAVGLPGIDELTKLVAGRLARPLKAQFSTIMAELPNEANVENALDRIRTYRELMGDSKKMKYGGLKGVDAARKLDSEVCRAICEIVGVLPPGCQEPHLSFARWLRALHSSRDCPVELFTTNYDLLFERTMEASGVPFFDGFVGSVTPFFIPEAIEAEPGKATEPACPPRTWTRLWKLHGSINWRLRVDTALNRQRIARLSGFGTEKGEEVVIFPSREKYAQSRKLPFIAFQDRLRRFVSVGECLVVIVGYSFSDEHLNDIIFQGLRANTRLAVMALMFSDLSDEILGYGKEYGNLVFYGPKSACIGGESLIWEELSAKKKDIDYCSFWDPKSNRFTLGDFNCFASFLELFIGFPFAQLETGSFHRTWTGPGAASTGARR